MQRIGYFRSSSRPFAVGKNLRRVAWILVLAAISARAELTIAPSQNFLFAATSQPKFSALELESMTPAIAAGREPFLTVEKKLSVHGRSNERMIVSAGYGQIWGDASMFRKICPDHSDPGWAYVKASFTF